MQSKEICVRKDPEVSVIIPVYNGSNYLREAIDSALAQTYSDVEILVVNDGSDDGGRTEEIALSYGDKIRYIKKENGGVASALNAGIRNMRGKYFSWLSHDDVYYPEKIEREMNALSQLEDKTRIVQCEYVFYDEDFQSLTSTDFHQYYTIEQLENSVFSVLQLQIHACGALIHKSHFERIGLFDEKLRTVQDIEMWFRLLRGQRSCFIPEALYQVREHRSAGSRTISGYYEETCRLYLKLVKQMDIAEMQNVFGSSWSFLIRMIGFVKSYRGNTSELEEMLDKCRPNRGDEQRRKELCHLLGADEPENVLAIFGAGQYGTRMRYELRARGIEPDLYLDNYPERVNGNVEGISCKRPQDESVRREVVTVVVALRNNERVSEQLKNLGYQNIISRQRIDGILAKEYCDEVD